MAEQQQDTFEGWALVEMMGHAQVSGYVTVKRFGGAAFFHVTADSPEPEELVLPEREWTGQEYLEAGSRVRIHREAVEKLVGAGSIYAITPCSEPAARRRQPRRIEVLERAVPARLAPPDELFGEEDEESGFEVGAAGEEDR